MATNVDLSINRGETKQLTFLTKNTYSTDNIDFKISCDNNPITNGGFEVVSSLPTTDLFEGREVMYNGKKYVYSSGWKEQITANSLATVATSGSYNDLTNKPKLYEANLLWGGRNIFYAYSPIDAAMVSELSANVMAFPNPAGISVEYSRDGGVTWLDYEATDKQKVNLFTTESSLYCGKSDPDGLLATVGYQLRITFTPIDCGLYTDLNKIIMRVVTFDANNCWATFKGLKSKEVAAGNEDDTYYDTIVNKAKIQGWPGYNVLNFSKISTSYSTTSSSMTNTYYRLRLIFGYDSAASSPSYPGLAINRLRFFGLGRYTLPSNLAYNNHLYSYDWQKNAFFPAKVESKELINFDVNNIEPTQTGSAVTKTSTWLWQYLVQGVNWLKANNVQLSAFNTKLDKRAYNQIYTNCGYVNVPDSSQGALIIELPIARDGDYNNSMTYIELNVYSHKKGCSKYIIGVYSHSQNSPYEWSAYSYMGYNYFSKISFGRRTDNNNIVVVLGDFTDLHKYEHFSITHIITGFDRNNDDTDGFLLYTDSDSNNYSILKQSTYNPLNISYDDLTNTPNLATVATSGSYNDLTNKPTLATVATSGSYNDLANTPTQLPNPNALKITVLDSTGALLGLPMVYDGVDAKYLKLTEGYGIQLSNTNLNNSHEVTINLKQIAGTTLLGNANDTIGIPQAVTMTQLRTMLGSLTLNDTAVTLGGNNSYTLPCYISVGGTLYQARITNNWLQIYRAGEWANAFYLLTHPPTECVQITDLSGPSWYDESVTEYELDDSATDQLLRVNSPVNLADLLEAIGAHQITFNSSVIPSKQFNKGALDNIINNLKGKGYSVFVENDIDTILGSGNDWFMSIKIKKVGNPYKAIIECYVAK